jgi:polyvinyl alcohol dehydrogenase (cytochrome)
MHTQANWLQRLCVFTAFLGSAAAWAQSPAALYQTFCATCHESSGDTRVPSREVLRQMSPEQILSALEKGSMVAVGNERSRAERRALAEYLSEKKFGGDPHIAIPPSAYCSAAVNASARNASGASWNGWGVTTANTRFQPGDAAGLAAGDLSRLKLKWAFGFPGAKSASSQPVVFGGRVYISSWEGDVYALDAKTGCIHWMMETEAGVRSAVSIGPGSAGNPVVYFGDLAANAYAVDAASGKLLWKTKVDAYPLARITGSPALHAGRLYVPVAAREESMAADPKYVCCRFRGSVVALDAATGAQVWKTFTIAEAARETKKTSAGVQSWGPSGAAVWVAPTIDAKRNALYVGTGNSYSAPVAPMSDAIVAMDLTSGKILWSRQITPNDTWNGSCPATARDHANCADQDAPDYDFASSPILVEPKGGKPMLIAGQKSGVLYALDPDRQGATLWEQRVGIGGTSGGIMWGSAVDGDRVYAALSDSRRIGRVTDPHYGGGLAAVELKTGLLLWKTPHPDCGTRKPCGKVQAAAVTAIPGVVFSGSVDGNLRAYSANDGKTLWEYNTAREFKTVNGIPAKGGSMSNGGVAVVDGMLYTNSGYSHHSGIMPGNVFLAFGVE